MASKKNKSSDAINIVKLHGTGSDNSVYELWIESGFRGIRTDRITPSQVNIGQGGPGDYGIKDPIVANAEWTTYQGGRGEERYVNDPSAVFDAQAWLGTHEFAMQMPLHYRVTGHRTAHKNDIGDVEWLKLLGSNRYVSITFTVGGSNLSADNLWVKVRRKGKPADLTGEIWTNSGGDPSSVVASATDTITQSDYDLHSYWVRFDLSGASDLTASTIYHVVIRANSSDTEDDCWMIATDADGAGSKNSSDGSTWASSAFSLNYYLTDTDINRTWMPFVMEGALYLLDNHDAATNSNLYIVGDRGIATTGGTTSLTDTAKSWTADEWIGARIKITKGPGRGLTREITDNGTNTLTFNAFPVTLTTASEYVIYDTNKLTEIGTTGIGRAKSVTVMNNVAYVAHGSAASGAADDVIREIEWTPATPGHSFGDQTAAEYADILAAHYESSAGAVVWRAENVDSATKVSRADAVAFGTDFSWGTDIVTGNGTFDITNIFPVGANLYVMQENEFGIVSNDRYSPLKIEVKSSIRSSNGQASVFNSPFLFTNWGHKILRIYGETVDTLDLNLPNNRLGVPSSMVSHPVGIFVAIDGGDNYSSVHFINKVNLTHFEVFRSYEAGQRIRSIWWEAGEDTRPKLWIDLDGDLVYIKFPFDADSPHDDTSLEYEPEMVIIYPTVDYGTIRTPGFMEEIYAFAKNLGSDNYIEMDYQTDKDVGTSTWYNFESLLFNTEGKNVKDINLNRVTQFRMRLRAYTEDVDSPTLLKGIGVSGVKQEPFRIRYTLRVNIGQIADGLSRNPSQTSKDFLRFIERYSQSGEAVYVTSRDQRLDETLCLLDGGSAISSWPIGDQPEGVVQIFLNRLNYAEI